MRKELQIKKKQRQIVEVYLCDGERNGNKTRRRKG